MAALNMTSKCNRSLHRSVELIHTPIACKGPFRLTAADIGTCMQLRDIPLAGCESHHLVAHGPLLDRHGLCEAFLQHVALHAVWKLPHGFAQSSPLGVSQLWPFSRFGRLPARLYEGDSSGHSVAVRQPSAIPLGFGCLPFCLQRAQACQ